MMIGNRKEGGRVCTVLLHVIRKSPTPSENRLIAILNWKKPKSDPGLEPVQPRQNAITLPLVPPPHASMVFYTTSMWAISNQWLRWHFYFSKNRLLAGFKNRPSALVQNWKLIGQVHRDESKAWIIQSLFSDCAQLFIYAKWFHLLGRWIQNF